MSDEKTVKLLIGEGVITIKAKKRKVKGITHLVTKYQHGKLKEELQREIASNRDDVQASLRNHKEINRKLNMLIVEISKLKARVFKDEEVGEN